MLSSPSPTTDSCTHISFRTNTNVNTSSEWKGREKQCK